MTLYEVAKEISDRLISIFRRDDTGRRPVYGGMTTFQEDPHWRDLLLFHEYFHGDSGAGPGGQPPDGLDRRCRSPYPALRLGRARRDAARAAAPARPALPAAADP
jgi:hypothetical protein